MSDTGENHGASGDDQGTGGNAGAGASATGGDGGTQGGTGAEMVPAADLARSEATARALQGEKDRLAHELRQLRSAQAGGAGGASAGDGGTGAEGGSPAPFDQESFRRSLLQDVGGVLAIQGAAARLQTEFPNADPSLFSASRLAEFGSPDALYLAAKESHDSITTRVDSLVKSREDALRTEMEGKYGNGAAGNGNGATGDNGADPTAQQLNELSSADLDRYMRENPGKVEAILRSATEATV